MTAEMNTNGHQESSTAGVRGDTARVLDELSRSNSARHSSQERRRRNGMRRFLIIVLLLVPVLVSISWLVYQQSVTNNTIAELRSDNAALQAAVANAATAVIPASPQPEGVDPQVVDELRTTLEARIEALARNAGSLQEMLDAAPTRSAAGQEMWSEAEYLLRLANQKLQLEGDSGSALYLLGTVDELLRDAGEPALFPVRDVLAGELLALRAMEPVDIAGLHARVNNLVPLVEQLSLRNAMVRNYNDRLAEQRDAPVPAEGGMVARALDLLRTIFVWQRWDVAPEALLPPPQEAILKQNLQLLLEQAQLALLLGEPEIYRSSLAKGSEWAARYFAIENGAGRTLREELAALASATITQPLPDISGSLQLLQQVNARRSRSPEGDGN